VPAFSDETNQLLDSVAENWGEEDAAMVKKVERVTNHDVKAIEYVLKEKFEGVPELKPVSASRTCRLAPRMVQLKDFYRKRGLLTWRNQDVKASE
jgi:hypothetical protein